VDETKKSSIGGYLQAFLPQKAHEMAILAFGHFLKPQNLFVILEARLCIAYN
jgi:hypothetical protein